MNNVYFLMQAKHNKTTDTWDKGVVVKFDPTKDNREEALQGYHAYLGAYAYGHDPNCDYVICAIFKASSGEEITKEKWVAKT